MGRAKELVTVVPGKLQGEVKSELAEADELIGDGLVEGWKMGRFWKERSRRVMTMRQRGP